MTAHQISDETRRNFHLFCDNFPFPVILVHKDRTILAVNKAAEEEEGSPTDVRCVEMGKREHHKGCLANQALTEQTAKRVVAYILPGGGSRLLLDSSGWKREIVSTFRS